MMCQCTLQVTHVFGADFGPILTIIRAPVSFKKCVTRPFTLMYTSQRFEVGTSAVSAKTNQ